MPRKRKTEDQSKGVAGQDKKTKVESKKNVKQQKPAPQKGRKRKVDSAATGTPAVPVKKEEIIVKTDPESAATSKEEEKEEIKKVTFTGTVPVDEHCKECSSDYHVYIDLFQSDVFNVMLNQTNIGPNNNKYYILQLLKKYNSWEFVVWFRWGRIGKVAGTTLKKFGGDINGARKMFEKKFQEKTGNAWRYRRGFIKRRGKYDMLQMDYGEEQEPVVKKIKKEKKESEKEQVKSNLDERVGKVIELIFDVKEFEATVKEMEFDVKKAPLGKLTAAQIKSGYESLKKIEEYINEKDFGKHFTNACGEFYTRIPHDFGMKRPPLISTHADLKKKIELLEALSDIQIAIELIDNEGDEDKNVKDIHYQSLGCKLEPFDDNSEEYKMVQNYVKNTHGSTHDYFDLEIQNVFRVVRGEDEKRFKKDIGNRMLLWHGSRLTNWCGILKQGLRVAPPEAPTTGYMFGKGIYFADMVSKSADYCYASERQPNGLLVLCEVALGNICEKVQADYDAAHLPPQKHSTKGLGREVPDPKGFKKLDCGTVVPMSKQKSNNKGNKLMYNEYIVYDVAQVRPRYLVHTQFIWKI